MTTLEYTDREQLPEWIAAHIAETKASLKRGRVPVTKKQTPAKPKAAEIKRERCAKCGGEMYLCRQSGNLASRSIQGTVYAYCPKCGQRTRTIASDPKHPQEANTRAIRAWNIAQEAQKPIPKGVNQK